MTGLSIFIPENQIAVATSCKSGKFNKDQEKLEVKTWMYG